MFDDIGLLIRVNIVSSVEESKMIRLPTFTAQSLQTTEEVILFAYLSSTVSMSSV